MNIIVNGKNTELAPSSTLSDLLNDLKLVAETVVIELNTTIVSPESYESTQLSPGDTVEIIRFVGGG